MKQHDETGENDVEQQSKSDIFLVTAYRRLSEARRIISGTGDPICACRLCRQRNSETVQIMDGGLGRSYYVGLQHCHKIWTCALCSLQISNARRAAMAALVKKERSSGHGACLITYTLSHRRSDSLKTSLGRLQSAHKKLHSGAGWQSIQNRVGWLGSVRAIEITYTENGWHPHIHELSFFKHDDRTPDQRKSDLGALVGRWLDCLEYVGGSGSAQRALDIRAAYGRVDEYVGKWSIVPELVSSGAKAPRGGGIVPFQMLDLINQGVEKAFLESLFYEYKTEVHGIHQLHPSPTYRAAFVEPKESGRDISDDLPLAQFDSEDWYAIWSRGLRAECILAARHGVLDDFLISNGLKRSV
jgi:hypothetical protein